jgi:hypothetical protein
MSAYINRESIDLQEIDVELTISTKIYIKKSGKIGDLKEIASRQFKQYGNDFDYFIVGNQILQGEDSKTIETLACYNTNKIVLKPVTNYKNQYEEFRKTLDDDGKFLYLNKNLVMKMKMKMYRIIILDLP